MPKIIRKLKVRVPHRISGFFEIVDEINGIKIENPEKIGSRGAGFNLNAFGTTEIIIEDLEKNDKNSCEIYINGKEFNEQAETTHYIFNYYKKFIINPIKIKIFHNFDLPMGCGYGASGSGALGIAFGLNSLLNLNLSYKECGRIAHIAEVVNRTGLGTVCGILRGGLCVLKEPGYPCVSERIPLPKNIKVVCGTFGMLSTKSILTDPILNAKIKIAGRKALEKLISNPNIKTFSKLSFEFMKNSNILNVLDLEEIKELLDNLNKLEIIGASMNQLGRSIFAICKKSYLKSVIEILESYKPAINIYNLSIYKDKPIFFKNEKK